jgi:hypothetical protein
MSHQKILILDFGSQVAQLIARRVREQQVYCELHPYDVTSSSSATSTAGHHPLRRSEFGLRGRGLQGAAGGVRAWRARPRHLLRHADHGRAVGRQGRKLEPARIRLCRNARPRPLGLFKGIEDRRNDQGHGLLDVWMSHGDKVTELPPGSSVIGSNESTPIAAMADENADSTPCSFIRRSPTPSRARKSSAASCATSAVVGATGTCPITSPRQSTGFVPRSARRGDSRSFGRRRFLGRCGADSARDRRTADLRLRR